MRPLFRQPRRRRRRFLVAGGVVIVLLVVLVAVGSWFASGVLIDHHDRQLKRNVAVKAVPGQAIVLSASTATRRPGVYGLEFPGGHAVAGTITASSSDSVTRRLLAVSGRLVAGMKVAIDEDVWEGDPRSALGIGFQNVSFPDPVGPMPAWMVPGRGSTWVIFVHGIDGVRAAGLRPLRTLHRLGLPVLLIDYRNDAGAPASPDHHIHLGMTEWMDLQAAARWALAHGASRLLLYGESMGGAIVTRFMEVSPLARDVVALVLDAPALDWGSVLQHQADRYHVPFMGPPVHVMVGWRIGFDWSAMNALAHARRFRLPVLLFQGRDDELVPPADSARFAGTAPGPVTYVPVAGAGHIESWNADPAAYDHHLSAFLQPWLSPPRAHLARASKGA